MMLKNSPPQERRYKVLIDRKILVQLMLLDGVSKFNKPSANMPCLDFNKMPTVKNGGRAPFCKDLMKLLRKIPRCCCDVSLVAEEALHQKPEATIPCQKSSSIGDRESPSWQDGSSI